LLAMPSIYLLRHCEYANPRNVLPGRLPVPLSKAGIQRAKQLRNEFKRVGIQKIFSSAVLRCKQTAEIISDGEIPIHYDQRLLETHSAYQGFWVDNANTDWLDFFSHRAELGGESLLDVQQRMVNFWRDIVEKETQNCVVCSHGDPLMTLQRYLSGTNLPDDLSQGDDVSGWLQKGQYTQIEIK